MDEKKKEIKKVKILIHIENGVIYGVYSDTPEVEVLVHDPDNDNEDTLDSLTEKEYNFEIPF